MKQTSKRNLEETVARMRREIMESVADDIVPGTVGSYSELHDYVDANGYGGAFETEFDNDETDFWNAAQDAVDSWIKTGGIAEALREEMVSLARSIRASGPTEADGNRLAKLVLDLEAYNRQVAKV